MMEGENIRVELSFSYGMDKYLPDKESLGGDIEERMKKKREGRELFISEEKQEIGFIEDIMKKYGLQADTTDLESDFKIKSQMFPDSDDNIKNLKKFEDELEDRYGESNVAQSRFDPGVANQGLEGGPTGITVASISIEKLPDELQ